MRDTDTLRTNGELPEAAPGTTPKVIKKVPKGTSAYQAAWIIDDDELSDDGAKQSDDEGMSVMGDEPENLGEAGAAVVVEEDEDEEMEEMETVSEAGKKTVAFQDLDEDEEKEQ
jgi:pre-rRNA-processing protein TSR1